jgi:large subunit ribosomal protein L32
MAVPKRKLSRARRNRRSSTWGIQMKAFNFCPNSGVPVAPHTVCLESGYYKGVKVLETKAERAVRRQEKRQKSETRSAAAAEAMAPAEVAAPEVAAPAPKKVKKAAK